MIVPPEQALPQDARLRSFCQSYDTAGGELGEPSAGEDQIQLPQLRHLLRNWLKAARAAGKPLPKEGKIILTGTVAFAGEGLPHEALGPVGEVLSERCDQVVIAGEQPGVTTVAKFSAIAIGVIYQAGRDQATPADAVEGQDKSGYAGKAGSSDKMSDSSPGHVSPPAGGGREKDEGQETPMPTPSGPIPPGVIDAAAGGAGALYGPAAAKQVRRKLQEPDPGHGSAKLPWLDLPAEEQQFMQELQAIPGNDAKARKEIELQLHKLVDKPVKKPLVKALQQFLKGRDLAVRCTKEKCGKPASLLWHTRRQSRPELGGYLQYSHYGPHGEHEQHGNFTEFPAFVVVKRQSKSKSR